MERYFEAAGSVTPPSAPAAAVGYPTNGNPGTGTPAAEPGEWWFHMMTEEVRGVLIAAGLTPDHADVTQLATAIKRLISGGDFKDSVRVASTANIAALTGLLTIDGVVLVAGDRVLVKDQGTGADNGIYVASAGAWTRATDADTGAELSAGATIPVEEGTANADTLWSLTTDGTITIGTTALVFAKRDVSDASTTAKGKVQLATSAEAQALTDALKALTPATLAAALQGSNQLPSASGYQILPGGVIVQWGIIASSASADITLTYPIAFPTACHSLSLMSRQTGGGPGVAGANVIGAANAAIGAWNLAGARIVVNNNWIAIGN